MTGIENLEKEKNLNKNKHIISKKYGEEHIFVNNIYIFNSKKYGDLINDDKCEFTTLDENYFLLENNNYINKKKAFDSMYEFAKLIIYDKHERITIDRKIENINDIYNLTYDRKAYAKVINLINIWINDNLFPYSYFECPNFYFKFLQDCILLYAIYNIHKWLIKISNNIEEICKKPQKSKELIELSKSISFINFLDIISSNNLNSIISNLPCNYSSINDVELFNSYHISRKTDKNYIQNYCDMIRRNIICYVATIINDRPNDFNVKKQKPFFDIKNNQYRVIENATCIVGISYQKLLFCLTNKKSAFNRIICKNEQCNNDFEKKGRREWCNTIECQKARNRAKNRKS